MNHEQLLGLLKGVQNQTLTWSEAKRVLKIAKRQIETMPLPDRWQDVPIACLGLSRGGIIALASKGIRTLGELSHYIMEAGSLVGVPGIDETRSNTIADKIAVFWELHDEYQTHPDLEVAVARYYSVPDTFAEITAHNGSNAEQGDLPLMSKVANRQDQMLIILDTTETFGDFYLKSPNVEVLAEFLTKCSATLAVPEVVVRETINKYRECLKEAYSEAKKSLDTIASLIGDNAVILPDIDLEGQEKTYAEHLRRRLAELNATSLDFEGIGLGDLIHRALSRRKPFDAKGRIGFRDAVIWETILRIAKERSADQIVFVTRNSQDFGGHDQLAKDLKEDLRRLGFSDDRVRVCSGLQSFAQEYVTPALKTLADFVSPCNSRSLSELASTPSISGASSVSETTERLQFDPEQFFRSKQRAIYSALNDTAQEAMRTYDDLELSDLRMRPSFTIVRRAWKLHGNRYAVHVSYVVRGKVTYTLSKQEYQWQRAMHRGYESIRRKVQFQIEVAATFDGTSGTTIEWKPERVKMQVGRNVV